MKKLFIFLFIAVFLISLVGAETFQQQKEVLFTKSCISTNNTICSSSATCNVTIKYPRNNTPVIYNSPMINNGNGLFNVSLSSNQMSVLGNYNWDMICCDGSVCGDAHGDFSVTKTGVQLSQDKAIIYLGMLALLIMLFIFAFISLFLLPSSDFQTDDRILIGINNMKYIRWVMFAVCWALLLAIFFVSSNISFLYLETTMMGTLLLTLYKIMMGFSLPLIILWLLLIFYNIFQDRETKEMLERGVQIGGNI